MTLLKLECDRVGAKPDSEKRDINETTLLAGGMLVMVIYHPSPYLLRRKERSFLYFSLRCHTQSYYTVFQGASRGAGPSSRISVPHSFMVPS